MTVDLSRRGFVAGLIAAPAIIRAATLMPVKVSLTPKISYFDAARLWDTLDGSKTETDFAVNQLLCNLGYGARVLSDHSDVSQRIDLWSAPWQYTRVLKVEHF